MKTSRQRTAQARTALPKARKAANKFASKNDPLGSYTGICSDEYEVPVQDADDL